MSSRKQEIPNYKIAVILWIELMPTNITHEQTISIQVATLLYAHTERERERGGGREKDPDNNALRAKCSTG
jgi:hypothetical protein